VERNSELLATPPGSPEWQREAERYNINAILVPLGRFNGLHFFPVLRQFCVSEAWPPVYLDEVAAVFVRRSEETDDLIDRLRIQCATVLLPAVAPEGDSTEAFNSWANAAAVLHALERNAAAFEATNKALEIFPDSAFLYSLRGNMFAEAGKLSDAHRELLQSAALESNGTTWSSLAAIYLSRPINGRNRRLGTRKRAAALSRSGAAGARLRRAVCAPPAEGVASVRRSCCQLSAGA
jgi:hypothetical protein